MRAQAGSSGGGDSVRNRAKKKYPSGRNGGVGMKRQADASASGYYKKTKPIKRGR